MRRYVMIPVVFAAIAAAMTLRPHVRSYASHYENVLGTSMAIRIDSGSDEAAHRAEQAVLASIAHDAAILSTYDSTSEFTRWFATRDRAVRVSQELFDVLSLFDVWRDRTMGALDPAAERVLREWREAAARQQLPAPSALARAVADVKQRHWRLDPVARTATHLTDTPLVLNSFVKSYIVDRAAAAASAVADIRGVVINVGGDIVVRGSIAESVGITDPQDNADNARPMARVDVRNAAIATSGGYRRGFDIAGRHYSHIVDPRTGQPTGQVLSATVIAPDGATAGALATALCAASPEEGERFAASSAGVQFMLVLADGSRIESADWRGLTQPRSSLALVTPTSTVYAAEQSWNPDWELSVSIELARTMGMAKRPYVAVWVEDKDKFPLRTIALWFDQTRYLPELRSWYRGDRLRSMAEGTDLAYQIASATRSPGKYTFKWDGKDQHGKLVKAGTYTINIEVTREHGTYQILHEDMEFGGAAKHVDFPANVEVASASIDYHKVAGK